MSSTNWSIEITSLAKLYKVIDKSVATAVPVIANLGIKNIFNPTVKKTSNNPKNKTMR